MTRFQRSLYLPFPKLLFYLVLFLAANGRISYVSAQSDYYSFRYLQEKFPELESFVGAIAMDPQGFIWFGGDYRIQRYDGNTVKTYPIRSMLENSGEKIKQAATSGFLTDSFKNFWVYSNIGLFLYQPVSDNFTRVCFHPPVDFFYALDSKMPEIYGIQALMEDAQQNLWVALDGGILFHFPISAVTESLSGRMAPPVQITLPDSAIVPVWFQTAFHTTDPAIFNNNEYLLFPTFRPEVLKLMQDKDQDIWINSYPRMYRLIQKNDTWVFGGSFFQNSPQRFGWMKNAFLDKKKNFWIGVGNYLALKRPGKPTMEDLEAVPKNIVKETSPYGSDSVSDNLVFHFDWYEFPQTMGFQGHTGWLDNLYYADNDQIFITNDDGVLSYAVTWDAGNNPAFQKVHHFIRNPNDPGTYWKDTPACIFLTDELVLFSGDGTYGVSTVDLGKGTTFRKLHYVDGMPGSLPKMTYTSIYDMGGGRILIGGSDNNLYLTDNDFTSFSKLPLEIGPGGSVDNMIQSTIPDGQGRIWIMNAIGQLAVFQERCIENPQTAIGCTYEFHPSNFENMELRLDVNGMDIDSSNVLWAACNEGLYWLDLKTLEEDTDWKRVLFREFDQYKTKADSLAFQGLRYLIPIKPDFYLLASENSVFQLDPLSRTYHELSVDQVAPGNNSLLGIWFYYLADDGTLWTTDIIKNSAITFHKSPSSTRYEVKIKNYTPADGFPGKAYEFVSDAHNNLWIYPESSSAGIVRFEPSTNTYTDFDGPGIITSAIFGGLHGKDRSGRIYLGAIDGITVFHPDSVKMNEVIPPIRITDIHILHKSIFTSPDSVRLRELHESKTLTLKARENILMLEFSSLSYANPSANRYAYILEGFDKDTVFTNSHVRVASYSNLSPGTYEFFVTGTNNNLKWSKQGTRLKIIVLPPWYATWYAYSMYLFIAVGLIVWWRRYDMKRLRLQHKAEMEHADAERLRELDRAKSEFFSNISHEFRTPLTLILGPLEGIIRNTTDFAIKSSAVMMRRNARRLHRLINQILDLSMLDAGRLTLKATCADLSDFVRQVVANFESAAADKSIGLTCKVSDSPFMVYFDGEKFEDILDNLLENAMKFTPAGGEIKVIVGRGDDHIWEDGQLAKTAEITVSDTGKGIPAEKLTRIFDRFYQVDASQTRKHEGAGIGLALVHELVKLHKGTIEVQSIEGAGTTFTISLRMGSQHLSAEEIVQSNEFGTHANQSIDFDSGNSGQPAGETDEHEEVLLADRGVPLILVVENNADMRQYIMQQSDHQFAFIEAEDGHQGYEKAIRAIPDLIISDLMMPVMDGYELCSKLRADERTRHIPVIILTAKAGKKHHIMGYDCGADDYVIKPFDHEMLLARIKNLLRERKMLAEKFSLAWAGTSSDDHIPTADEKFIQRLNAILEKQYSDPEFGTNVLSREAGFSHSVLYRKLKSLTNHSPNAYIRNYRLIKAHELLSNKHADIGTVAYLCGFNNLSYFSKCYRQFFNRAPHEDYTLSSGK